MENELISGETQCPSCGRYVGIYDTCPYCQASMNTRWSLKVIRRMAWIGSIAGLLILWFGVQRMQIPTIPIGQIDLRFNLSIARFQGEITDIRVDEKKNSFRIWLDDQTGHAVVMAGNQLDAFRRSLGDRFPQVGDRVSTTGNISISEGYGITQFLSSPHRYELLERSIMENLSIEQASRSPEGTRGIFVVHIVEMRAAGKRKNLTVSDKTGSMTMVLFENEFEQIPENVRDRMSDPGEWFRFRGRIDSYRQQPQLRLVFGSGGTPVEIVSGSVEPGGEP